MAIKADKPKAIKKVTELTGAGLRVSKDYVDNLLTNMGTGSKIKSTSA
jgi:ribosomal protein L7/L12